MGEVSKYRANEHGHVLHRWDASGQEWACAACDHGPFCRLCTAVDAATSARLDEVAAGRLHVYTLPSGRLRFAAVAAGEQAPPHADPPAQGAGT